MIKIRIINYYFLKNPLFKITRHSINRMNRYSDSKIYCLWGNDNYYYIGSTINELKNRLYDHKKHSQLFPDRKVYKHFNTLGWNNVKIECLEEYSCADRNELLKKEDDYIKSVQNDSFCLNQNSAFVTEEELLEKQAQYRKENRNIILEYKKAYRDTYKDRIAEYNRKYEQDNKEIIKKRRKQYIEKNKDKINETVKAYAETHKEAIAEYKKKWAEENKEKVKESQDKNKENHNACSLKYYEENKEKCIKRMKEYRENNKELLKAKSREYTATARKKNPLMPILCECGGKYTHNHSARHQGSKKHTAFINSTIVTL